MNNSLGEMQGIVSAEQPIEGLGQQGESLIVPARQRGHPARTISRPTSSAAVQRPAGDLRAGQGRANRPAAIQPGCGVKLREGALAGHSTKSAWLGSRQKSARSMGAARKRLE